MERQESGQEKEECNKADRGTPCIHNSQLLSIAKTMLKG